jgi:hypothetical protein
MELLPDHFRERVHSDARLYAIVTMLEGQLVQGHVTTEDIARCAVLAAQIYAERHCAPVMIQIVHHDTNRKSRP